MKKILFFIPSLSGGGAEKVLVNLVNTLNKKKYEVSLLVLFDGGVNKKYLNNEINYQYVFKKAFRGNIHLFKLFTPKFLFNRIIKEEYDIIVSFLQGPTTRIIAGCTDKETILVNWVHTELKELKTVTSSYRNKEELIDCYSKYDSTVFVAKSAEEAFNKLLPEISTQTEVLYNIIDSEEIHKSITSVPEDIIFDSEYINLISVGRFVSEKGFERLIKIIKKLVYEDQFKIRLYLLGEGKLEKVYKKLISLYNLEENVYLMGFQDNPYKYIYNSEIFVCSSYREGFSTAVTEALILGTPVITTKCSGMEELLGQNEYGIIVKNNESDLYEGLKKILKDKDEIKRLRLLAQKRGLSFHKSETIKLVENHFDNLIKKKACN